MRNLHASETLTMTRNGQIYLPVHTNTHNEMDKSTYQYTLTNTHYEMDKSTYQYTFTHN